MSNHQFHVFYGGKKKTFKVSGSSTIAQVTMEVVDAFDLPIDAENSHYALRHKKSVLDPSCPMRFAAIPSNAELQLEMSSSSSSLSSKSLFSSSETGSDQLKDVKLAISIEGTPGSITESFSSSVNMLSIVQSLIDRNKIDSNRRAQDAEILYIRQKFTGLQLESSTLRSIGLQGLSGRIQIRFPINSSAVCAASMDASSSAKIATVTDIPENITEEVAVQNLPNSLKGPAMQTLAAMKGSNFPSASIEAKVAAELAAKTNDQIGGDTHTNVIEKITMPIEACLQKILSSNFDSVSSPAIVIVMKYVVNIIAHPQEEKYRTINASNKIFVEKISVAHGALDLLQSIGFQVIYKEAV